MNPKIIQGGFFEDARGSLSFVNDFDFSKIERFYVISNSNENPVRAWQGHKLDEKNFYCIQGAFKIYFVKIDNWKNPNPDLKVESCLLNAHESKIIQIPPGYANAVQALEEGSKLLSFSTLPLDRVKDDDVRFDKNTWKIDD
jgi:dTDP-4-dehydrorhamnose 3,5-epimerase-like enzyme